MMERREQGTTDYRYANERQPVRTAAQRNTMGAASGVRYANTANQGGVAAGMNQRAVPTGAGARAVSPAGSNTRGMSPARKGSETSSIMTKPRTAAQVKRDREMRERAAREANTKAVKASGKPDIRMLFISVMGIFVIGAMGWGICQHRYQRGQQKPELLPAYSYSLL